MRLIKALRVWLQDRRSMRNTKVIALFSKEQCETFMFYVCYQAQHSLHEYYSCFSDQISWEDFNLIVRGTKAIRTIISEAIMDEVSAIAAEPLRAEYIDTDTELALDGDNETNCHIAEIFSQKESVSVIFGIVLMVQYMYFCYKRDTDGLTLTWNQFIESVEGDDGTAEKLCRIFKNYLYRMDFNKYWHQNHVVGIISGQRELLPQLREKAASVGTRNIT